MQRKSKLTLEQKIEMILYPRQRESKKILKPGSWYIVSRKGNFTRAHMYAEGGKSACGVSMPETTETLAIEPGYPVEKKCKDCRWIERHGSSEK